MYEAFDKFLARGTWHTQHQLDEDFFFVSLASVIKDPKFNPDALGEYIRQKTGVSRDDRENLLNVGIDRYVAAAWAVRGYLKVNKL